MGVTTLPLTPDGSRPPGPHAAHDELLIVRFVAGDVSADERDRAAALTDSCEACRQLALDLAALTRATESYVPAVRRRRGFQLSDADAARLRPPSLAERLRRLLREPRRLLEPAAGALVLVGLVMAVVTAPGVLPFASSGATTQSEAAAPALPPAAGVPGASGASGASGAAGAGAQALGPAAASHASDQFVQPASPGVGVPVASSAAPPRPTAAPFPAAGASPAAGAAVVPPYPAAPATAPSAPGLVVVPPPAVKSSPGTAGPAAAPSSGVAAAASPGSGPGVAAPVSRPGASPERNVSTPTPASAPAGIAAWQVWAGVALLGAILFLAARFALRRRDG